MARLILPGSSPQLIQNQFDFIGDSRSAAINSAVNGAGTQGNHYFPWVMALSQRKYRLGLSLGYPGKTTDQWINTRLSQALASNSGWLVMDMGGCVNDLAAVTNGGVFPWTDTNGVVRTTANVGTVAANNIIAAAKQALSLGKKVIFVAENGANNLATSVVPQLFVVSAMTRAFAEATPNAYFIDFRPIVWNPAGTAIGSLLKTALLSDGTTHYNTQFGYLAAQTFKAVMDPLVLGADAGPASQFDVNANNPMQLFTNPMFQTLTGGTKGSNIVLSSGTIPSGITLASGATTTSCAITSAADAAGFGNDVTFALTATATDTAKILFNSPSTALLTLGSFLEGGVDCSIASGAVNAGAYWENSFNTNQNGGGTASTLGYDLFTGSGVGSMPNAAMNLRFRNQPIGAPANASSIWYVQGGIYVYFAGAGNMTLTLSRPTYSRKMMYTNGNFSY